MIVKLANPYNHKKIVFNSDSDLSVSEKQALRFVDIKFQFRREFCIVIPMKETLERGVLDIQFELWSPARLFIEESTLYNTALFHRTNWRGGVEIIKPEIMFKVFISYSWQSEAHITWVRQLSEELLKHHIESVIDQRDLLPGDEITEFMEKGTEQPICLCICSTSYTEKANNRNRGVGYEVSMITNDILDGKKKSLVIPIIRDNPTKQKPRFFGSTLHIDMDTNDWRGEPLSNLINAIKIKSTR